MEYIRNQVTEIVEHIFATSDNAMSENNYKIYNIIIFSNHTAEPSARIKNGK